MSDRVFTTLMAACDALIFLAVWFGLYGFRAYLYSTGFVASPINPIDTYFHASFIYLPFWLIIAWQYGLYNHSGRLTGLNQMSSLLRTLVTGMAGSLAIAYLFKQWDIGRFILLLTAPLLCLWFYFSRTLIRLWKLRQFRKNIGIKKVIVIGVGRRARRTVQYIKTHPSGGYQFLGYVDYRVRRRPVPMIPAKRMLGLVVNLESIVRQHSINEVFLATPALSHSQMLNLVSRCEHLGVDFKIVGNLFGEINSSVQIAQVDELPVVHLGTAGLPPLQAAIKRLMDIVVSSGLLVLFGFPMVITSLLIRLDSPGPAVFTQKRIGLKGEAFRMFKFRTMKSSTHPYAMAPSDAQDDRVTRIGYWLRRFSLDEFPQLINVLLGEMSMVGPRPEMPFIVENYSAWEKRRLDVKPGITGLWQIIGRKNLPLALNMEYDFYYIKNQSLFFDIIILAKTIPAVIFGRGAF